MTSLRSLLLSLMLGVLGCFHADSGASAPPTRPASALEQTRRTMESGERLLVVFPVSTQCLGCPAAHARVLADEHVRGWLASRAHVLTFDIDEDVALATRLGIEPRPSIVVLPSKGSSIVIELDPESTTSSRQVALARLPGEPEPFELRNEADVEAHRDLARLLAQHHVYEAAVEAYAVVWDGIGRLTPEHKPIRNTFLLSETAAIVAAYPPARARFASLNGIKLRRLDRRVWAANAP